MAKRMLSIAAGLVIAAALCGSVFLPNRSDRPVRDVEARVTPALAGVPVETAVATQEKAVEEIHALGTLVAHESVEITTEIPGRLAKIHFKEADRVVADAVLIELDADILRAELARARSDLALATTNHDRARTLADQGVGTLRAHDEANAAFYAARANLVLAEARLSKAVVIAPFAGVVGFRAVSVGAYVSPGDRIVELAMVDPLKVDFRVSEVYLPHLRLGLRVHVTVDARPGEAIEGEIVAVDPIVDVNGRAVRLRARVRNPDGRLSAGMFARIRIVVDKRPQAILVPEAALFRDGPDLFVYRLQDGKAVRTEVAIGRRLPGHIEVQYGLDLGAVVVTAGHQQLRDGARVQVVAGPRGF